MRYWLLYAETHEHSSGQAIAVAKAAERLGFAGIAVADHVALPKEFESAHPSGNRLVVHDTPFPDPLITIAMMAAVTTTLQFMTYVYILPMREPFSVAKQVGTLAILSDYRFIFGVGVGWHLEEVALLGQDLRNRGRRVEEMLTIMRSLWSKGEAKFDGEFYRFDTAGQYPVPQQRIPVWIGGKSDAALQRAARYDGWLGMNYPMEELRALLAKLRLERQRHLDNNPQLSQGFQTLVIPYAAPSEAHGRLEETYGQMEDWGIDGTVVVLWGPGSPAFRSVAATTDSINAKIHAMEGFADKFIR